MTPSTPEATHGRATPAALIPLWTWLAIVTVSIALFFHLASQGSPWTLEFGLKPKSDSEVAKSLAGIWGLLFLLPSTITFFLLSLSWMTRRYASTATTNRWDRLPAPEFWNLPVTDPITRTLRLGVWLLVFVLPLFTIGHLAFKHFGAEFFQQCRHLPEAQLSACLEVNNDTFKLVGGRPIRLPPKPSAEQIKEAVRPFAQGSDWQRFVDHIHPKHLHAPYYFDHSFYFSNPSGPTYFPGLQAWAYLAGILVVLWLWLRIVLSWVFGRMVLTAPWATVRRIARLRIMAKAAPAPSAETLPPPQIRIGVIGHRKLSEAQSAKVQAFLKTVLPQCQKAGYGLRIVSGMAAGADRLAAQWAIDQISAELVHGDSATATTNPQPVELLLILPGQHHAFRDHGVVDDPKDFDAQYACAKALETTGRVRILELPGIFNRHQDPALANTHLTHAQWQALKTHEEAADAPHRALRIAAHRYKTDVLLRQCEFLVAVMALSDSGKPGGTRECVEQALALGTPVLVLDIDTGQSGLVTRVDQLRPGGLPLGEAIDAFIAALDRLPAIEAGIPTTLGLLASVYRPETPPRTNRLSPWWSYFEAWFASPNGPKPSAAVVAEQRANAAQTSASIQPELDTRKPEKPEHTFFGRVRSRIASEQRALMAGYRGAFVLAYVLGLLAVTLALGIVLLLWFWPPKTWPSLSVLAALTALKFGVVLTISKLIHDLGPQGNPSHGDKQPAIRASINDRAVALRYVSERLRIMPTMVKLGSARMDLLHQSQRMGDTASVAEDLCRRIPLTTLAEEFDQSPKATQALEWLRNEQKGQVTYNLASSEKSQRMHHRLEQVVATASKALIWIILADFVVLILKAAEMAHSLPSIPALMPIGLALVVITAFLPALMATCNALLFQTQCEQRAERELDLAKTLQQHKTRTDALAEQIQSGHVAAPIAAAVLAESERTAAVLAEEVAEWAVMTRQQAKEV